MKFNLKDMVAIGIRHSIVDRKTYLYWEDVKEKVQDVMVHSADILIHKIDGKEIKLVRIEDIFEHTDFDKKIIQTLNFNPKDKKTRP